VVFEPGSQLGRYEIQRRLGRGGMGTVYVAHDPVLGRMVAIKVFAGELDMPDARERFTREARAAAGLSHPNIVTVYDFGEHGSQPYIVMEYVPGETMANLIRRKVPVLMADKLRWIQELCAGAGCAHAMSVVHRDIKPANLMIDRSGRLKILDFGIARLLGIASNTSMMIGTPGYMAPEQITGDPVDHRADQFSIGVVFYELLSYTEPFPGDTLPAVTHRILNEQPKPLMSVAPDATPEIAAIVDRALQKSAADRFPDTEAMRSAVSRLRRQFNADDSWSGVPTIPAGRDTPGGTPNRGTGSARRRTNDAVGVAQLTPPPDPRRTDREELARLRAAQVEAALAGARTLLANQQLETALAACQQALLLDEANVGAIALEIEIQAALQARDEAARDPDMTIASGGFELPSGASRPPESQGVTRVPGTPYPGTVTPPATEEPALAGLGPAGTGVDRVLQPPGSHIRPTGHEQTYTARSYPAPQQDPPSAPVIDPTIVVPSRRTPPPVQQTAKPATLPPVARSTPAPQPPPPGPAAPPTPARPAPAAKTKVPVKKEPSGPGPLKAMAASTAPAVQSLVQSLRVLNPAALSRKQAQMLGGAVAVVVLLAAATAYFLTRGPAPTGTVVIDAVPWGTVTGIRTPGGDAQPLPEQASTPLPLVLPAGTYEVTLTGPPPESRTETVTVQVGADGVTVAPITRFQAITPEQYFEQYLGSVTPGAANEPADAAGATPSAQPAAALPAGGNQ